MPPKPKSGNFKQKNKPFKGGSNKSSKKKTFKIDEPTKRIRKPEKKMTKPDRKNQNEQIKEKRIEDTKPDIIQQINSLHLDEMVKAQLTDLMKSAKPPKIVAFMPFNSSADTQKIKFQIESSFKLKDASYLLNEQFSHQFPYFNLQTSPHQFPELTKESYVFLACDRDFFTCLDFAKVADIICPVLSCKDCIIDGLIKDPHSNAKAFDEEGYRLLTALRIQGVSKMAGIIQDLEGLPSAKQSLVKKFFHRYFTSELGSDSRYVVFEQNENGVRSLLRNLQGMTPIPLDWREKKGYILIDRVLCNNKEVNQVEVFGFLKGSAINANQLFHLTGYGDYPIARIDILKNPTEESKVSFNMEDNKDTNLFQIPLIPKNVELFAENSSNRITENLAKNINQTEEMVIEEIIHKEEVKEEEMIEEEDDNVKIDDDSDVSYEENEFLAQNIEEEKKKLKFELKKRSKDEMEFEDEVDYPADISLKERFKKYKGLKNFRTSEWKKYEGLPSEYERIFIYEDYYRTMKNALNEAKTSGFAYPGLYLKITLRNIDVNILANHPKNKPLILSSNLTHEGKISQVHFKVKKWVEAEDFELKSKDVFHFEVGFRKFESHPIFSRIFTNCDKTKYDKLFRANTLYMASIYSYTQYSPCNVLLFKSIDNKEILVGSGELFKVDPFQVILKRIVLTGYPTKINKRRAVIHMMFFNPNDVRYFKPIELITKLGLKGNILESIGTHGSMKIVLSSYIKGNDTICLNLYRRVFPKFKFPNI